jgi:hypothetical protein
MAIRGKKKLVVADFEVPRTALEAYRFAGMDDARENLHSIHFEADSLGKSKVLTIHAVTTDGHRMLHVSWVAGDKDVLHGSIDVSASEVRDFLKYAGKAKKGEEPPKFRIRRDGHRHDDKKVPEYILSTDKRKSTAVSMDKVTEYPQWRQIIPRIHEGQNSFSQKFGINIEYLIEFGRYLNVCGFGYSAMVHYSDEQALGPIRFVPGGVPPEGAPVEVEYVLMPVRT